MSDILLNGMAEMARLNPHLSHAPHKRPPHMVHLAGAIIFPLLIVAQLVALKALPYSTSLFEDVSREELDEQSLQPQNGFSIGSLRWDIRGYASDPKLEPFRRYFRENCGGKSGVRAALCLSDKFAEQFPSGEPKDDFFSANYDPAASLVAHTEKGEPGHCVTRAGLATAALLSMGIPARVVQLIPLEGAGHNIFSVWDEKYGWVAIDPSYGYMIGDSSGPSSAHKAQQYPKAVRLYSLGEKPDGAGDITSLYVGQAAPIFRGHITYPEPWLYLRTGPRAAPWPFRGKFAHVGPWQWSMGPAQKYLRYGISLSCPFAVFFLGSAFMKARSK